jgi:hypothetical protein
MISGPKFTADLDCMEIMAIDDVMLFTQLSSLTVADVLNERTFYFHWSR